MQPTRSDAAFTGSVPQIYSTYLVPLLFEDYARDLARRLAARPVNRVLEVAAGTGVVTRALDAALPANVEIVATDLQQPMLDQAAASGTRRPVTWQQADAQQLPFDDRSFDAVVCQFGVMFFPDKVKAYAEARRVLRPGGVYIFNVWDGLETNDIADIVTQTAAELFPANPPRFLARVPYGYADHDAIRRDLTAAGFTATPEFATVAEHGRSPSARAVAIGYCQGTPIRGEFEAQGPGALDAATAAATEALQKRFGTGAIDAPIQAHIITVTA